jgi:putative transcriptional regulator
MNNRLRELRAEREWSQADLAERLAVSRQTINAIETGKYDPSLPLAFAIAKLFGLSIESIFSPTNDSIDLPVSRDVPFPFVVRPSTVRGTGSGQAHERRVNEPLMVRKAHHDGFFCSELVDRQHGISPRRIFLLGAGRPATWNLTTSHANSKLNARVQKATSMKRKHQIILATVVVAGLLGYRLWQGETRTRHTPPPAARIALPRMTVVPLGDPRVAKSSGIPPPPLPPTAHRSRCRKTATSRIRARWTCALP